MRSILSLVLLFLVAAYAIAAPETHAASAASAPLDARGMVLIMITVIVVAVETVRRLP
ncbi:MAG TPA: hypothetical protein VGJ82_02850 [Thermoanaerobaculia bacterium]